jgi:hypothetical protein
MHLLRILKASGDKIIKAEQNNDMDKGVYMTEFNVLFIQRIRTDNEGSPPVSLERQVYLPFAPFIGLEVSSEEFTTLNPVSRIVWDIEQNQFCVYCQDDSLESDSHKPAMDTVESIGDLIEIYQCYGWENSKKIRRSIVSVG